MLKELKNVPIKHVFLICICLCNVEVVESAIVLVNLDGMLSARFEVAMHI